MIKLHHLDNSRSQRILWMLEELGLKNDVDYLVVHHKRDPKTMMAPQSLRAVHPLGKSPVLVDDSQPANQQVFIESGAILEYLVSKYGRGRFRPPAESPEFFRYTFWMHFAEGSAMTPLLLRIIFDKIADPPLPLIVKPLVWPVAFGIATQVRKMVIDPGLKAQTDYMETELSRTIWFAGDEFTAADVQMSFVLEATLGATAGSTSMRALELRKKYPKLSAFLDRVHGRPAYKRALEVGGPFTMPT